MRRQIIFRNCRMGDGLHLIFIISGMRVWYKWLESESLDFPAFIRVNTGCRGITKSLRIQTVPFAAYITLGIWKYFD